VPPGLGGTTPGGGLGGLGGADSAPGAGYKGFDRWEYWWEYNKDRFLSRMPIGAVTEAPGSTPVEDPFVALRHRILLPALRKAAGDRNEVIRAGAMLSLGKVGDLSCFSELYKGVKDKSPEVRKAACLGLGYLGVEDVAPVLMRILLDESSDGEVRAFAAAGLGLVGAQGSVSALIEVLDDGKQPLDVRGGAALALGLIDDESATRALVKAASDRRSDKRIRALAVSSLGRQGSLDNAITLVNLLRDKSPDVRRSSVLGLGAISYESPARIALERALERQRRWEGTDTLAPEAKRILEETIEDLEAAAKREEIRIHAIRDGVVRRLAHISDKESDLQVRAFALVSLAEIGTPAALSPIRKILERKSSRLLAWAGLAAGVSGEEAFLPYLRKVFSQSKKDPSTRAAMAIALGLLKDRDSAETLAAVARDPGMDPDLRGYSVMALGMMWDVKARALLRELFDTKGNPSLHRSGAVALGLVGRSDSGATLVGLMERSHDLYVKAASTIALGYLRDSRAAAQLAKEAADPDKPFLARLFSVLAVGYLGDREEAPPRLSRYAWHHNYRISITAVIRLTSLL
jgi:HEAT repeat protein